MLRTTLPFRAAVGLLLVLAAPAVCQHESVANQVSRPNYTQYLNELLFTRAGDDRGGTSAQHETARARIRDTFASFGLTVTLEPFLYRSATYYNVVGVRPGKTRPADRYVLGAHYDSAYTPGADDDASGVAALLEAARIASMHDYEASIVFVAFDLEENGYIGSKAWALAHAGDRIRSMVALDMIAFNPAGPSHNLIALCVPNTSPNATLPALQAAVARYGKPISSVYGGVSTRSDHYSFAGLAPAVEMIEASFYQNSNYHQISDTVDTPRYIDYDFAVAATRSVVGYLADTASLLPGDPLTARLNPGGVFSAAAFTVGAVAPAELVTLMGSGFGTAPSVAIRDSAGRDRPVAVTYASMQQVNIVLPPGLEAGPAALTITTDGGARETVALTVEAVAPGIFTAAANGMGAAAAQVVRVALDGTQTLTNAFECQAPSAGCVPVPVDFGPEDQRVVLVLYGTGIRGRSSLAAAFLEIGVLRIPVQYAGPQPSYPGLDQVNVELPRTLRGAGKVSATLRVDGRASNAVELAF